jgi:hypothetical protein
MCLIVGVTDGDTPRTFPDDLTSFSLVGGRWFSFMGASGTATTWRVIAFLER